MPTTDQGNPTSKIMVVFFVAVSIGCHSYLEFIISPLYKLDINYFSRVAGRTKSSTRERRRIDAMT